MDTASLVTAQAAQLDASPAEAVVVVESLMKRFGKTHALRGVSFTVRRGEIFGVVGPDGAGKSSLLKAIAGVLAYDGGHARVFNASMDTERSAERAKARMGFMPQGIGQNLYGELTAAENVEFFAQLRLVPMSALPARRAEMLRMAGLEAFASRAVKHLSGGMKQRLALACTLVHHPELLVLDEPSTGVDPMSRREFWERMSELASEQGITAVISTSYLDEIEHFDRVAVLRDGELVAEGTPTEIEPLVRERPPGTARIAVTARAGAGTGLIEARGLVKDFGGFRAVDQVSFVVREGETCGLLGANGAGKTTVIKMLTGLVTPTEGEPLVAGSDMRRASRAVRGSIGYVSQAFSLYQDLTVAENITLAAGIYGLDARVARERVRRVTDIAGLEGLQRTLTGRLPAGVRQRAALACALVHQPRVLFLDEPTAGMDPDGRARLWEIFLSLARDDGVAILLTTHHMVEAERCDRVVLMSAGRVVGNGAPSALEGEMERRRGALIEIETQTPRLVMSALAVAGYDDVGRYGRRVHVFSRDAAAEQRIATVLRDARFPDAIVGRRALSLEDVFVQLASAPGADRAAGEAA